MPANPSPVSRDEIRESLRPTLVAEPLRSKLKSGSDERYHIIVDLNNRYPGGVNAARSLVYALLAGIAPHSLERNIDGAQHPFVFAELTADQIDALMRQDFDWARGAQAKLPLNQQRPDRSVPRETRAIFKIWESEEVRPLINVSVRTVKADAAQSAFAASGENIVWAVLDSGINSHPHFETHGNLTLEKPLEHRSFTRDLTLDPCKDGFGHGTHVAGIIAGTLWGKEGERYAAQQSVDATGKPTEVHLVPVKRICGMAPRCKLLSLRVLDDLGNGDVTAVIQALEWIIQLNGDGSKPLIHGVNLSAGYLPDPENYGSGQSPICRQVNRAVRSGLVVVVAAGNYGYASYDAVGAAGSSLRWRAGEFTSLADPANAELAITVGSTHREEPHRYGISYFSSKGPTCDGRLKPDVVAPGERILSCAAGISKLRMQAQMQMAVPAIVPAAPPPAGLPPPPTPETAASIGAPAARALRQPEPTPVDFDYLEDTGTSMAAPHVSGVIAAFLSIRREFIGEPEKVANLLTSSAMDLKRDPRLQGAGLVDLFRMLQSV